MEQDGEAPIVNPRADVKLTRDGTVVTAVTVRAAVKGRPLRVTIIEPEKDPELFGALLVHATLGGIGGLPTDLTVTELNRLTEIGFLVTPQLVSSPVSFACDVNHPPDALVPFRARNPRASAEPVDDLVVNPTLRHAGEGGPPPDMRGRVHLANPFRADRSWLWFEDTHVCAPCLYSYPRAGHESLSALTPGERPPATLSSDMKQRLLDAGILQSRSQMELARATRAERVAVASRELRQQRYTVLRHVIRPLQLAAIRRYYRDLIAEGFLPFGDKEWRNRYFTSLDPVSHFFHAQLTGLVQEIVGEPLKASFPFFASYHPGADLPAHKDREQCEYAMSILLDHSPEPEDASPWPLFVQPPDRPSATALAMGIGDAVLYFGREVLHYREPLTGGQSSSSWFFFYVPENFEGPLD